jgi:hypothetical protein
MILISHIFFFPSLFSPVEKKNLLELNVFHQAWGWDGPWLCSLFEEQVYKAASMTFREDTFSSSIQATELQKSI